jgi:hypothetical protein
LRVRDKESLCPSKGTLMALKKKKDNCKDTIKISCTRIVLMGESTSSYLYNSEFKSPGEVLLPA